MGNRGNPCPARGLFMPQYAPTEPPGHNAYHLLYALSKIFCIIRYQVVTYYIAGSVDKSGPNSVPKTMDPGSESYEKTGGNTSTEILQPAVLFLSGQSVFVESATPTLLYQLNRDIRSILNKESSVALERVEQDVSDSETEIEGVTPGTQHKRHIFYLAHPVNAQYRTDIPAKYYITSAVPEMVGNIRFENSEARFQKTSFKAMLSTKRTASDKPLFYEGTQQLLLFDIQPNWKVGRNCYKWSDSNGRQVAVEEKEDDRYKLSVTSSMSQVSRDALVATWLLRLWHDTAESKQAKRECELSLSLLLPNPCNNYWHFVLWLTSLSSL